MRLCGRKLVPAPHITHPLACHQLDSLSAQDSRSPAKKMAQMCQLAVLPGMEYTRAQNFDRYCSKVCRKLGGSQLTLRVALRTSQHDAIRIAFAPVLSNGRISCNSFFSPLPDQSFGCSPSVASTLEGGRYRSWACLAFNLQQRDGKAKPQSVAAHNASSSYGKC